MKNIIICGLVGTGKTTIAKKIENELSYNYIDLYNIIKVDFSDKEKASKEYASKIDDYLLSLKSDKYVIDCDYLILPEDFNNYKSKNKYEIIYLGFNDIDFDVLYNKFKNDYIKKNKRFDDNKLVSELKYIKEISKKVFNDCKKYNYKFFDINKDKSILVEEIYKYITDKLINTMLIVELGIKLDKSIDYYDKLLKDNGLINDFKVITHDLYYTNKNLNGLTENEMKNSCIRLRSCNNDKYKIQNNLIKEFDIKEVSNDELINFENKLAMLGYKKIFDTTKKDFHYCKSGMGGKIQLQQIENIGLILYYDNKEYYGFDLEKQRKMLIDELNLYGFNFDYNILGLDKLRTLYYKKEMYSKNQNG